MRNLVYISILFIAASCSNYQQIVKKGTPEQKLKAAKEYYQDKDYVRSIPLLEELLGLYFGKQEREEIFYLYAYSHYGDEQYLLAGYYFNSFSQTYPLSTKREETSYMAAVCNYHQAMPQELDQTPTKNAINSLQAFINQYPNSKYVDDSNVKIDELRGRVLVKVYENAKLYHGLGYYKSAVVACQNALDDYPDMIHRDELSFLAVDASYLYAKNSIQKKQEERYQTTLDMTGDFLREFKSSSKYGKEVTKIKQRTEAAIAAIK